MIGTRPLLLPTADGRLEVYSPGAPSPFPTSANPPRTRVAYAAAHVVSDPLATVNPWVDSAVDWDTTLAYRRYLWDLGFSVAEAMDTAQRGMGLDWTSTRELIRRALAEARAVGAIDRIACGAGTDQLLPGGGKTLLDVIRAYEEQCAFVEEHGGRIILMASRALAACASGPDDYLNVYDRILSQVRQPVILHWLGDMFDAALVGYWGCIERDQATEVCLRLIQTHADKVAGIKVSLLDEEHEVELRRRLPVGVRMFTGDDFNYPTLIRGDERGYSDALLGIFDAIAPAAAAALAALDRGDRVRYAAILEPTVALSRHIFHAPTRFYKTGVVFLAYLNGHQRHFEMVGGQQSARSIVHLAEILRLADRASLLRDPEQAQARMRPLLALAGID
ncbi:MAG TPA: dihydrodipicolinate synthase family protein [Ktedonobacterales bacterium]|nr:dihydrodipicolinate synthase family protein [Ktedonobacterales bacterium]